MKASQHSPGALLHVAVGESLAIASPAPTKEENESTAVLGCGSEKHPELVTAFNNIVLE